MLMDSNMYYRSMSAEHVKFFEKEGYLCLRATEHGLVQPSDVREWTDQIQRWPQDNGKWMIYDEINTEGKRQLMRTEKLIDYHPQLQALLCGDAMFALLKELTGKVDDVKSDMVRNCLLMLEILVANATLQGQN